MPFETPTPATPWIRGASPMEAIVPGANLGQRIAESNQQSALAWAHFQAQQSQFAQQLQLQEQHIQAQQEFEQQKLQAQQDIAHQNQLREDQQLLVNNAYKQSELGLQQQKVDLTRQVASQKFAAWGQMQNDIDTGTQVNISLGMTPEEARQKATIQAYWKNASALNLNPQSITQLAKSAEQRPEAKLIDIPGGQVIRQPTGTWTPWTKNKEEKAAAVPMVTLTPSDITDPQSQLGVHTIRNIPVDQLRNYGITNVGKYVVPQPVPAGTTNAPAGVPQSPVPESLKRWRYNPSTGKLEEITQADTQPTEEEDASANA